MKSLLLVQCGQEEKVTFIKDLESILVGAVTSRGWAVQKHLKFCEDLP
jgi:hypothetical protein